MNFKHWLFVTEKKKSEFDFSDVLQLAKQAKISKKEIEKYSQEQLVLGINVEKEHMKDKDIDVIKGDESKILKIALAHLREDEKYYSKLKKIEKS